MGGNYHPENFIHYPGFILAVLFQSSGPPTAVARLPAGRSMGKWVDPTRSAVDYRPTSKEDFEYAAKWVPALPLAMFWLVAFNMPTWLDKLLMGVFGVVAYFVVLGILKLGIRLCCPK
jgi:hypothetical protein